MSLGMFKTPTVENEPIKGYAPGSSERASLKAKLAQLAGKTVEIPMVIGGKNVRTGDLAETRSPHNFDLLLSKHHQGGEKEVQAAVNAAAKAHKEWSNWSWEERAAVFLKAADLLAGPYRDTLNAATMLGQSKTAFQAEIDSACELIDFFRFNIEYMVQILHNQPASSPGIWNRVEYRPLEGFVFAVTPFNFTSIAGNLPTATGVNG